MNAISVANVCLGMLLFLGTARIGIAADRQGSSPQPKASTNGDTNTLRLNFRGAPLDLVLEYLADAGGFVINKQADLKGTVDVWSKDPVSSNEAVTLLNSVLRKNGYAVTRSGRILTVIQLQDAKTSDLEVVAGNDPEAVAKSEELVTQIISVRHANAAQLVKNLELLLPASASLTANESANSLILVSTQRDVRRALKVIKALDSSLASVSSIKVFPLSYADARQLATVVQQLFAPQATSAQGGNGGRGQTFTPGNFGGAQGPGGLPGFAPGGFGGAGGFGGQGGGGPGGVGRAGGDAAASGGTGNSATTRVVAVADELSNSLVVSAPSEVMPVIEGIVKQVDVPTSDITELRVFKLVNADPAELSEQLKELFPDDTSSNSGQTQGGFRFGGGFPGAFGGDSGGPAGSASSERSKKQTRVISVPDSRSSSLIVSAAVTLMPQVAAMIEQLDSSSAHKEVVKVFELKNANPSQVNQILQDLFHRNTTARNNESANSLIGDDNPLTARQVQQQQNQGATSAFGNSGGGAQRNAGGGTLP